MTTIVVGVLACSLVAVLVLVVVALPHLREGEDLFTDAGRERLAASGGRLTALASSGAAKVRQGVDAGRRAAARPRADEAAVPDVVPVRLPEEPARPLAPVAVPPALPAASALRAASALPAASVPRAPAASTPSPSAGSIGTGHTPMAGVRSTTYRGTGTGDVVSSRSPQWQALSESSDPATRAAARVVDLRDAEAAAQVPSGAPRHGEGGDRPTA